VTFSFFCAAAHRGLDKLFFFALAEQTMFAGVRIQTADPDMRLATQASSASSRQSVRSRQDRARPKVFGHLVITDVRRGHAHRELVRIEPSCQLRLARVIAVKISVWHGKFYTRELQAPPVDRRCDDALDFSASAALMACRYTDTPHDRRRAETLPG